MSKLTTDVVTYCTEASNQKSKYAYRKIFFYKKALAILLADSWKNSHEGARGKRPVPVHAFVANEILQRSTGDRPGRVAISWAGWTTHYDRRITGRVDRP